MNQAYSTPIPADEHRASFSNCESSSFASTTEVMENRNSCYSSCADDYSGIDKDTNIKVAILSEPQLLRPGKLHGKL